MEKSYIKKIIKQIERLCEKQYRKGFQQGFDASRLGKLTEKQVYDFRANGEKDNYVKIINPLMGYGEVSFIRLRAEMQMPDMEELQLLMKMD